MKYYIKFFGDTEHRWMRNCAILNEVRRAESHAVAGFSRSKPPSAFVQGDIIYLSRMVTQNNEHIIFGKATVADQFTLPRDEATESDIERIKFRNVWCYYLQLINPIFILGNLSNGVELKSIIDLLGGEAFERTRNGRGWLRSVRQAFCNQPYIELTIQGHKLALKLFDEKINVYGYINPEIIRFIPTPENAINQ